LRGVDRRILGDGFFGGRTFANDFVDAAVGRSGREESAVVGERERLHLEFFGSEDDGGGASGRDAVDTRGRSGGGEDVALLVGHDRPDVGGGRSEDRLESRRQFERAVTANGDT